MNNANESMSENSYIIIKELVYYDDPEKGLRLGIPRTLFKEVFQLAHNKQDITMDMKRTQKRLTERIYILNMAKQLKTIQGRKLDTL